MYAFEARIQVRPAEALDGARVTLRGGTYGTLDIRPAMLASAVFPITFEQAEAALAALPRLFIEPDGSFVWVAARAWQADTTPGLTPQGSPGDAARAWQVDGQLYDRHGRLIYIEVRGKSPKDAFDHLLRAFGWPDATLVFQLIHEAVYLDETGFRRYAAASAGGGGIPIDREAAS